MLNYTSKQNVGENLILLLWNDIIKCSVKVKGYTDFSLLVSIEYDASHNPKTQPATFIENHFSFL